ncbi:CoA transferase [Parafrankia discariae]|uniref:CoA transferase n=1 Tax=Parafrankia discariae TaxID=365528 RepID=UPI00036C126C|nr:CoA transferase [Parafrankia discariae]
MPISGPRVIKAERPGGADDPRTHGPFMDGRSLYFARVNHGEQSVVPDLGETTDRDFLLRIVDRVDVLVENFRLAG